jgi:hypothetical protein
MYLNDYSGCDATELRRLIGAGEITAGEPREAALRAIEAVDPEARRDATLAGRLISVAIGDAAETGRDVTTEREVWAQ